VYVEVLGALRIAGSAFTPPCLRRGYSRLLVWLRLAGRMCAPYNAVRWRTRYSRAYPRLARPGWPIFAGGLVLPDFAGWD
jgi:hypothetical protein